MIPNPCVSMLPALLALTALASGVHAFELPTYPNGDTIPDFSNAGYRAGSVAIPDVPAVATLSPAPGDNTARIQQAVDAVAARPMGADGFRGALLLASGVYPISGTVYIRASGVVIRGAGSGTNGTILRRTAGAGDAIIISGSGSATQVGSTYNVTNNYVPVGAKTVTLSSVSGLAVGDTIKIVRPSPQNWLDDIGMGGTWTPGGKNIVFDRVISAIQGTQVTLDAPITIALEQKYGGATAYKYAFPGRVEHSGIEDIRGDCTLGQDSNGNFDGALFAATAVKNCWIRRCHNDKMKGHSLKVSQAKWCTFRDIVSFHNPLPGPHSGPSTQIFTFDNSQLLLFYKITASDGGFEFTSGSLNPGPNVYLESKVPHGFAFSGPHMPLAVGTLYDSLEMAHGLAQFKNGPTTSHGWAPYNHVDWNVKAPSFRCERVSIAHLWNIGCSGPNAPHVQSSGSDVSPCEIFSWNTPVTPASLYRDQLAQRVGAETVAAVLDGGAPVPTPTPSPTPTPTLTPTPTPTGTPTGNVVEITPGAAGVTASTHDGNLPGNTVDGNLATRWSANGDGQWIRYDLGAARTLAHVGIAFYSGNTRRTRFDLQVSGDGAAWTNAATNVLSGGTTTQEETFDVADQPARYVRILGHGNTVTAWNSVTEVRIFGVAAPVPTPTATPTPTASPAFVEVTPPANGVSAGTHDGNVPANAVDGSLDTRWSSNGDGHWLRFDLGAPRTLTHVAIAFYKGNERQSRFDLQVSADGTAWTDVLTGRLSGGTTTAEETIELPDQPGTRYVRYVGHGNTAATSSTWNSLNEVSLFAIP